MRFSVPEMCVSLYYPRSQLIDDCALNVDISGLLNIDAGFYV